METLQVSIMSERRVFSPYGLKGGQDGTKGINTLLRKGKLPGQYRSVNFGGKNTTVCRPGDRLRIETPGGGGWGRPDS